MELFEYYDLYSLLYSFSSLNSRIDNIIYHYQVSVDFSQVKSIEFIDFLPDILSKFNPKNIRSLHSSDPDQLLDLAQNESLIYFIHIRSLSLNNIELHIVQRLVSRIHFSHLERVLIGTCNDIYTTDTWSIFHHFLDSNRYQFLRTYKDSHNMIKEVTSVLLLEYVTFSSPSNSNNFLNFLNQSPNLKYIKAQLFFDNPIFSSSISYHDTLTHLNLNFLGRVYMKTIIYLFQCVPQICYLKLKAHRNSHHRLVDPMFWEKLLSKYLVKLKRLSLDTYTFDKNFLNNPIWKYLTDKEKINKQIEKSNYWSSHPWKTKFNSGMPAVFTAYWAQFVVV
jgi:hypothetical protein